MKQIIGSMKFKEDCDKYCDKFCQLQLKQKIYEFIKPTCKDKQVLKCFISLVFL